MANSTAALAFQCWEVETQRNQGPAAAAVPLFTTEELGHKSYRELQALAKV
jgi:hypothetical protein